MTRTSIKSSPMMGRIVKRLAPWSLMALTILPGAARAQQNPHGLALPNSAHVSDKFTPLISGQATLTGGFLGTRISINEKSRLLHVDENDMLDAFERRDAPHQDWQGEHVGKFLHAATLGWAYTHDPELRRKIDRVVARLLKTQEPDGYLGTYPAARRWTSWDVWVHKYDLLGLLTYYQFTGNHEALAACRKIGDLLVRTFGTGPGMRDINRAGEHMGMAADSVLEPVVLLYRATKDPRYLAFANYIVSNYDAPGGPAILASLEKYHSVRRVANAKAYEMTSNFNGMLELYRVTGDKRLLKDMLTAWEDIVHNRLYITGSASSYEVFQDNDALPNGQGSNICETCVTVTWEQMNLQLLRLTGDPRFADEAERSIYNHLLAAQKPTGDDWVYYTPLDGHKQYDSATTCCHSSGPRGVALIPSIAYMTSDDGGIVVNIYNNGAATASTPAGDVTLTQTTNYPLGGKIHIAVDPKKSGAPFTLRLRIPGWATTWSYAVNGKRQEWRKSEGAPSADYAHYVEIRRTWKRGDAVDLDLAIGGRMVEGAHSDAGRAAILYGPLVLALDTMQNPGLGNPDRAEISGDRNHAVTLTPAPTHSKFGEPVFEAAGKLPGQTGEAKLYLTPYADAGQDGKSHYTVWIPLPGHGAAAGSGSLFEGAKQSWSRAGNVEGDIADGDTSTYRVTYNAASADKDWFAVTRTAPALIDRVVFAHGLTFHDGGWFDTSDGKPLIQIKTEANGAWQTVAALTDYPAATATDPSGLQPGQKFEVKFAQIRAIAIRIIGKPACGDKPQQSFSSCAELQAFGPHPQ